MEKTIKDTIVEKEKKVFNFKKFFKYLFSTTVLIALFFSFKFFLINPNNKPYKQSNYYGEHVINIYESSRSYPFIERFLTAYFLPELNEIEDQNILDAGCGVGLWSIYAASNGGNVYGIDIQPGMIEQAQKAVNNTPFKSKIFLTEGDAANLPYDNNQFDKAISINVACNLDNKSFQNHFNELKRVIKNDGYAILTVPISHEIIFTNGSKTSEEVTNHVYEELDSLKSNPTNSEIMNTLSKLDEVMSATFYLKNNRLSLLTNPNEIKEGTRVWRKLPNIVIPNHYHSEKSLKKAIKQANLKIRKVVKPVFNSEQERNEFNLSKNDPAFHLGKEYLKNSTFIIYYLEK